MTHKHSKETIEKIRLGAIKRWADPEQKKKHSMSQKNRFKNSDNHPRGMLGKKHSEHTLKLFSKQRLGKLIGEDNPNWRGGTTKEAQKIRTSKRYKRWRSSVFFRDNYTCTECGSYGGELNADHIKPFALYPELRFDVSNGRTLCVPCHKKTPAYGYGTVKNV